MAVTFQLPADLERDLRIEHCDLDNAAREALLVALYRQGKISHHALSQALGVDRFQAEEILHKHNVIEDLGSVEEQLAEVRAAESRRIRRS